MNRLNTLSIVNGSACLILMLVTAVTGGVAAAEELSVVQVTDVNALAARADAAVTAVEQGQAALGVVLRAQLQTALQASSAAEVGRSIQQALDRQCLLEVSINPESRVKLAPGPAPLTLQQGAWKYYLVKVVNDAGVTAPLAITSQQATRDNASSNRDGWLEIESYLGRSLGEELSGDKVEYRVVRLLTDVIGKRSAVLAGDVGQGTGDIGFRNDVLLTFRCAARGGAANSSDEQENSNDDRASTEEPPEPQCSKCVDAAASSSVSTSKVALASSSIGDRQLVALQGSIVDAETGAAIPARVHVQSETGEWYLAESEGGNAVHYRREPRHMPGSVEVHTTLSPDPFELRLPPGKYTMRVERGKEYIPAVQELVVQDEPLHAEFRLQRWINMAERGWYSGDTHVHRSLAELPNILLAEDLNVALPLTYWVTEAGQSPALHRTEVAAATGLIEVSPRHVIYPINTEYEIERVGGRDYLLGAAFVLNHARPLPVSVPPVSRLRDLANEQGALIDLDKHCWPWSFMLVPVLNVDLFELANNHVWQTEFGLGDWGVEMVPPFMHVERDGTRLTEAGWIDFGFQTYYMLLNCGFRMRVSAGTASGVHPVQLGFGRVYVHLPDGFDYQRWIEGLDAGKSFVSNGPMLEVTFNGHPPGENFRSVDGQPVNLRIAGEASAIQRIERIEIVVNGRVDRVVHPENQPGGAGGWVCEIDEMVPIGSSSWVAVRCFESHSARRVSFAHTNPVFVDIAGKPLRPRREEVDYLIGRMQEEIELNRAVFDAPSLQEFEQALAIYQKLAEVAQ